MQHKREQGAILDLLTQYRNACVSSEYFYILVKFFTDTLVVGILILVKWCSGFLKNNLFPQFIRTMPFLVTSHLRVGRNCMTD